MNHIASFETRLSPVMASGIEAARYRNCISAATRKVIVRIPEPILCLPTILLSLLAGALGMSAFFGILLPMLLSVPAIGSQLGASGADAAYPLKYCSPNLAPVTNAVSTTAGVIAKREDFNRPPLLTERFSFELQVASRPAEAASR